MVEASRRQLSFTPTELLAKSSAHVAQLRSIPTIHHQTVQQECYDEAMVRVAYCPACGSGLRARFEADCGGRRMKVSQCDGCGSYVKDPFFDPVELEEVYRHYSIHETHYDPPPGEIDALVAKIRRIGRYAPVGGDFLEIGCGRGHLLDQARGLGWKVHGLEIEGSARDHLLPGVADAVTFISSER